MKFTAAYGLVVLVLLAIAAQPRAWWWKRVGAIGLGAAAGAYWYVVNASESGRVLGDQTAVSGLTAVLSGPENVVTAFGLLVDFVDLSGAVGADLYVFAVVALLVAGAWFVARRRDGLLAWRGAVAAGGLVLVALPLYVLSTQIGRPAFERLYEALDSPHAYLAEGDDVASSATTASDTASWFGPVGLVLVFGIAVVSFVLVRGRELPAVALVAAGAPLLWLALLALTLTYHPWQGRFLVFPVALSAALWGVTLRVPAVAWGLTALAGTTAALSLVHFVEKPSGIRLLERDDGPSVWQMSRVEVQSLHDVALTPLLEHVSRSIPPDSSLALALGANDFGFPYFDPRLERRIALVPWGSTAADVRAQWLVANPERAAEVDRTCWEERLAAERGTIFERTGRCAP